MRKHALSHGLDGWSYRVCEVPLWRSAFSRTVEWLFAVVGHPCCRWGWACEALSRALNVSLKAEHELLSIPLTSEQAAQLPESAHFDYLDDEDDEPGDDLLLGPVPEPWQ